MTNSIVSKMVEGQEKQVQSPTRAKGSIRGFYSPKTKTEFSPPRYAKASNYRSPRSSPSRQDELFFACDLVDQRYCSQHKSIRCSPSKSPRGGGSPSYRSPRLSPSHGELYAGFSDSPEPTALPQPPSHWIFPNFSNLLLDAQA